MKAVIFAKRSERFPGKHMTDLDGTTLIDHVVKKIHAASRLNDVLIYTKDESVTSDLCDIITDQSEGTILNSIHSAIQNFGTIFAFAGDMPCLSPGIIDKMIEMSQGGTVVPVHINGIPEPLHSIYSSESSSALRETINLGNRRLRDFISGINHEVFEIKEKDEIHFYNVNYMKDLQWIKENGCIERSIKEA